MRFIHVVVPVAALAFDRLLKTLATRPAEWDFGPFEFRLFENYGLVFSWPAPSWASIGLMVGAIVVLTGYLIRNIATLSRLARLGGYLIVAGAVSNLYDRVVYGFVIDYFYIGQWWPVFNVADAMIAVGVVLMIAQRRGKAG